MPDSQGVIAIVEDDFGMREALARMLKAAGFEARAYGSAEAFLECGSFADLNCLVVDIHLPGASGIDLQRRLAEDGEARPVVFITAHDSPLLRREAEELGAVAFLAKPFEGRLLLGAVREALGHRSN
jgi:FixJ family two-component response regulator